MYALKAFAENNLFTSNVPGVVSSIGELSTLATTFAKDKGLYNSQLSGNINIVAFKSTIDGSPYIITGDLVDDIVSIIKYVYDSSQAGIMIQNAFLTDLLVLFNTTASNFACGSFVNEGANSVPEWISWESKNITNIGTGNLIKIWLSDNSFKAQYDEYEIVVVPPITNVDVFHTGAANVLAAVNAVKADVMMNNVQHAKGGYPESILAARVYNYIDPTNPANLIPTIWNILIYGNAGNNDIIIQNALIDYILANSTKTQLQWTPLLPDIFKHTEFLIVPEWTQYAIPNRTLEAGIYSPIVNIQDALTSFANVVKAYASDHIVQNISIMSQPYKSLTLLVVGGPDNKNNLFKIKDIFPDFIDVSSTSQDFNRMSQATQDWATLLANMIFIAETMTINSSLPEGMSRATRNNILYLVSRFDNIDYLIASKSSF